MERHSSWNLTYDGYEPAQEGLRETLCALGNGYFVTRAAAPDSAADGVHYPGTYLAGGYNRLITEIAGREDRERGSRELGRFQELLSEHRLAWQHVWEECDVKIGTSADDGVVAALRLHIFHLLQTASYNTVDLDVGVPPRGWHGEAYRGHILWDELFIFPFLNLRIPALTRADHASAEATADGRADRGDLPAGVAAGRLYQIAQALGVDVGYFFEGLHSGDNAFKATPQQRMLLELARNFISIPTRKHQDAVSALARSLASSPHDPGGGRDE